MSTYKDFEKWENFIATTKGNVNLKFKYITYEKVKQLFNQWEIISNSKYNTLKNFRYT